MAYMNDYLKRVVIVEDNKELRQAYTIILKGVAGYYIPNSYDDCESCIAALHKDRPDLILMDLNLPGMNGLEGIPKIKKILPDVKIVVITVHDDSQHVFDALCAGAMGYITKDSGHNEVISAIEQVFDGGAPMSTKIATLIVKSFHINPQSPLTSRETDVLKKLSQGRTYDYIARELFITRDTVKTHIRHIYEKLQVSNRSEAVIKARRENFV